VAVNNSSISGVRPGDTYKRGLWDTREGRRISGASRKPGDLSGGEFFKRGSDLSDAQEDAIAKITSRRGGQNDTFLGLFNFRAGIKEAEWYSRFANEMG
jgi:hypothetical protein